jgi:formylglycine-generating enzyme required for sulfatase activity
MSVGLVFTAFVWLSTACQVQDYKDLPKNRRNDQYESRDEFLHRTAEFETERLHARPWRFDGESEFFESADVVSVPLGNRLELRFRRVESGRYIDGITPDLKNRMLDVENRNGDLRRWEDMLDTERRDKVSIDYDFFVSETIIPNALFAAFVQETGYQTTVERYKTGWIVDSQAHWLQGFANSWDHQVHPMSESDHPVVQVSWFDAMHFAGWLNEKAGVIFRLPTKEEWLLAARPENMAGEICVFPWGNEFGELEKRMNFGTAELTEYAWIHEQFSDGFALSSPVKAFPANDRGLHDMLGNVWVWNWTNSERYLARPFGSRIEHPESLMQLGVDGNHAMTMTGGCYLARMSHANLLANMSHPALDGAEDIGFRLVAVRKRDSGL